MSARDPRSLDTHFEFGENWRGFLRHVDQEAVAEAERGLLKLIPQERIEGARFLDIGCGSGLHSLAASRLGAAEVLAIDIDPKSVRAAQQQLSGRKGAEARRLSIFDAEPAYLGAFDLVYSWGVLHHTGAMWEAVERAAQFVKPGGLFAIALYQKTPFCGLWRIEKRLYTASPEPLRWLARALYTAAYVAGLALVGRNPLRVIRDRKNTRGMNFHTDIHDWLGGYPYESAEPAEIKARIEPLGFVSVREYPLPKRFGLFGTGCCEFVFQRHTQ